jgi:hypothetical protein
MALRLVMPEVRSLRGLLRKAIALAALGLFWYALPVMARQPTLVAIELYDGPSGPAYMQLTDVLVNGKIELRDCTPFQAAPIDKSTYGKLQKVVLAPGGVLERDVDGALRYRSGEGPSACVLPDNVKFDHNTSYSLSDFAERAMLTGTPVAPASGAAEPLKAGVKLVFVAEPNVELAEFLLAQRESNIDGWLNYLAKYPATVHTSDAKLALASLYVTAGELSLETYKKSLAAGSPSYSDLKDARVQADKAQAISPGLEQTVKLSADIRASMATIAEQARAELDAYQAALKSHSAGYVHLQNARMLSQAIAAIDAAFPAGVALLADVTQAGDAFDNALRSAESSVVARQMEQALATIAPLRPFAGEEPRVQAVIDAAYNYYLQRGKEYAAAADWDNANKQFENAVSAKDTPEAEAALKDGRAQLTIAENKAAAASALASSKDFEQQHDLISAFEVLYSLPAAQRALVADDITRLKDGYIQSASQAVRILQKTNIPIRGRADEIAIEKAYGYLQLISELNEDSATHDAMGILGHDLSAYFVDQSKVYLDKPVGSGTELGWTYLQEALFYEPSNQAAHDAKVAAAAAHAMHSKISIRVQFRDQTSLRESTGFISQLEDAIITGLESSALQVKAVRFGETTGGVEPDFQLNGDVLEHQITETPTLEARESKYRAGTHDDPNEAWNKANRAYDAAVRQLQTDQSALEGAESKGKKKDISDLNKKIAADQKQVTEAQLLADSLPKTVTADVLRTYQYTRRTVDIKDVIQLQFRIGETLTGQMGEAVLVEKQDPRQYVMVEDVKPDDTEGIRQSGTVPNTRELQTALESSARDALVEAVRTKVLELPRKIYDSGKSMEQEENTDGAGEYYLRYLSCTPEDGSAERRHARDYLADKFNMHPAAAVSP